MSVTTTDLTNLRSRLMREIDALKLEIRALKSEVEDLQRKVRRMQ